MLNDFFTENVYPSTDLANRNLDFMIRDLQKMMVELKTFVSINSIKYANPIRWDITRQYEKNTIVIDPLTGTAYISVAAVPIGVALTRTEYWTPVFDLEQFVTKGAKNFASRFEEQTTLTATFPTPVNGWLVWNSTLYRALTNIVAGDQYTPDSNIKEFTMEDVIGHPEDVPGYEEGISVCDLITGLYNLTHDALEELFNFIGNIADLQTEDKSSLVAAINELVTSISELTNSVGDLSSLNTEDKSSIVEAINEVNNKVGNLTDLNTEDKSSIVEAINEVLEHTQPTYYVLPEDFGAIGDGVHDDTAALQEAINSNNCVEFTSGKIYLISNNISLNNNQIINGNHSAIKIKDNVRIREIFTVDTKSNVLLSNITFNMNCLNMPVYNYTDYNQNAFLCKAIYLNNSKNVLIANCNFINLYTWAIFVYECTEHISIINNDFKSPAQAQGYINEFIRVNSMWTGLLTIDSNTFTGDNTNNDFGTPALSISNVHAKSIINGNTLINCGRNSTYNHRLAAIDFYGDVYNASITNNYIEAVNMFIRLEDTKNILVDNNICKDVSVNAGPLSDGYIWIFHSDRYPGEPEIENITIRNNVFHTKTGVHKGNVIRIREYSNDHDTIFIKNVIIENNKFYRGNNKGFSAIETDGRVNGLYIKGNIFDDDIDIAYIIRFTENSGYNTVPTKCMITDNTFKGYIAINDDANVSFNMLPLIIARNIFICSSTEAINVHKGIFLDNYFSFGGIQTDGDNVNNSFITGNIFDDSATNPITSNNTIYTNNIKGTNILSNQS